MKEQKNMAHPERYAAAEIKTKSSITHSRERVKFRIFEILFHVLISALGAFAVAVWAVPVAYAQRGYYAIGGEWLLVILTFVAVLYATEVQE